MLKHSIKVEIDNLKVDEKYFSFDYKVTLDGKVIKEDSYDVHVHGETQESRNTFRKELKDGYALQLVLEGLEIC